MIHAAMIAAAAVIASPVPVAPVQRAAAEVSATKPVVLSCEQDGGRYRTVEQPGGARGVCALSDSRKVDAPDDRRQRHRLAAGETQLPNPAAVFCVEEGGTYRVIQGEGGARGLCVLPDGREVDAWDYYRERHSALPSIRERRRALALCRPERGSTRHA